VDGVMTPLNQKQGYKEAKVGVIFWQKHHQKKRGKRGVVRQREYVATLKTREEFRFLSLIRICLVSSKSRVSKPGGSSKKVGKRTTMVTETIPMAASDSQL